MLYNRIYTMCYVTYVIQQVIYNCTQQIFEFYLVHNLQHILYKIKTNTI